MLHNEGDRILFAVLILVRRLPANSTAEPVATLSLTAAERVRSRHRHINNQGQPVYLNLPRGTVLRGQDLLISETGQVVRVLAQPEPVLTVTAKDPLLLLRAAYHLGNRHVALEVTPDYLRLEPDPVLETMLHQLGVQVVSELAPFEPEAGAYGHSRAYDHGHSYDHTHAPTQDADPSPAHSSSSEPMRRPASLECGTGDSEV